MKTVNPNGEWFCAVRNRKKSSHVHGPKTAYFITDTVKALYTGDGDVQVGYLLKRRVKYRRVDRVKT